MDVVEGFEPSRLKSLLDHLVMIEDSAESLACIGVVVSAFFG